MFSSNDTPAEEYTYANRMGAIINLDDITHIDFCEEACGGKLPETMSCRYNPGGVFQMSNGIMDNPGDSKYGMTPSQMVEAYRILMRKGVKHFGIHAFLASNTVTNEYYPVLAKILFEVAVRLHEETGVHIGFINLSGGIGMGDVAIYTELGRFMLAPYGCLVSKVIHEKHTHKEYIGLDACAVNLMRPAMYGAYHHITVMGKEED